MRHYWMLNWSNGLFRRYYFGRLRLSAGNWSTPASDTITVDTTPPAITITSPLDGAVLGVP